MKLKFNPIYDIASAHYLHSIDIQNVYMAKMMNIFGWNALILK